MTLIARYSIAEAIRRRVFTIIVLLTTAFVALYGLGTFSIFGELEDEGLAGGELIEETALTGGTLVGLGMFVTFFLGVVLAVFMTMSTARGDAERGVLQPLVVRPIGRTTYLLGRLAAAAAVACGYVVLVYAAIVAITWVAGDWTPDNLITPALGLDGGGRDRHLHLGPRLGASRQQRQRNRRIHDLRGWPHGRPHEPDR